MPLSSAQSTTMLISFWIMSLECVMTSAMNLKSAANAWEGNVIFASSESINMSYNTGPSVEPWMTPEVTSTDTDNASSTRTRNVWQFKKLDSHYSALPQIPKEVAASITKRCRALSKVLAKSNESMSYGWRLFLMSQISALSSKKLISVERPEMKPCWRLHRSWLSSMYLFNWVWILRSRIFPIHW